MDLTKIKAMRTYQSVSFEGKMDTFFTTQGTAQKRSVDLKIVENIGVLISTDKDVVLVPFPNIAGIYMITDHYIEEEKKKKEAAEHAEQNKTVAKPAKIKKDPIGAKRL